MIEVMIPLGALRTGDPLRKHYAIASYGRAWALSALDDRQAMAAALVTIPAEELACVPELAEAGREVGVAETPWTPELRALRACEALRYAYPLDYADISSPLAIAALIDGCGELFADAPANAVRWTIRYESVGTMPDLTLKLSGVARASVAADPDAMELLVFASRDDLARYDEGDDDVAYLSLHFAREPQAAVAAVRDYQPLFAAPSAKAHSGMPRSVDDLECGLLGALCHALGMLRRIGQDTERVHLFTADAVQLRTRILDVQQEPV
jgi:hypothetical protein